MRPIGNYAIISIDQKSNLEKYVNGIKLYMAGNYQRQNHNIITGTLVSDVEISGVSLKEHTQVFFKPVIVTNPAFQIKNDITDVNSPIYNIHSQNIFGYVENDEYHCLNDWVLCTAIETWEKSAGGLFLTSSSVKKAKEAIVYKIPKSTTYCNPRPDAKVIPEFKLDFSVGDRVMIEDFANWELEILGNKYFIMQAYCIMALLT